MYSVYTMPETTDEEVLKNGHSEDCNTEEEEEEDNEHDSNGIGAEANGWCARQGNVDGNRVILVGRIDPMEHVEPVYGTDEDGDGDGDEDDDDDDDDDDSPAMDRDGCGSDCSHGRSEEIAAESDGSVLDAWLSALIGPETARPPGDPRLPAGALAPWGGLAVPFPTGGAPPPRPPRAAPHAPAAQPTCQFPESAPGTFSLENLLRGGAGGGDDRPYCCPVCQQRFARYSHYARHLYFAHENEGKQARPPTTEIRPEVSLVASDVPLPVNSEAPAAPHDAPTSATFVYGDTLIFRGVPKVPIPPTPRILVKSSAPPPSRTRTGGLGEAGSAPGASSGRSYDCPVCEMTFPDRESRARHAQEHEQFHCGVCGRGFRDEVERDHHTSMYAGKPAHKCNACGKCFHLTHSFARHMRTHTGEQPFACEVCGKRFNDSGNMAKHMRTHTGDLPYPCPQCPRRFSDRANRAKHARTHHGDERPFPCVECGRTFANGSNLARHLKAAHRLRSSTPTLPPHFVPGPLLLPPLAPPPHRHLLAEGVDAGHPGAGRGGGVVC